MAGLFAQGSATLIFAVHLWKRIGPEPETIWEVMHHQTSRNRAEAMAGEFEPLDGVKLHAPHEDGPNDSLGGSRQTFG